jgi:hypothetical protein
MNLPRAALPGANVFLVGLALLLSPSLSIAEESFDGKWLTTVSCEAARDALGYSFRFVSEVKGGNLRGVHGTEGQPSSLVIEGRISARRHGKTLCNRSHGIQGICAWARYAEGYRVQL